MFYTNDPYFQVKPYEIPLRGLTSEVQLFHMSDLHLIVADENSTPQWQEHAKKAKDAWQGVRLSFAKLYGDSCDEAHLIQPEDALPKYVELVNEKRPDAMLMTGDMLNDYSPETIAYLGDALAKVEILWMWVRGNHELGNDEAYRPYMKDGALVQILEMGNLTLIGIDNSPKKVSAAQAQAVKDAAEQAARDGKVPVLTMHIPIKTPCTEQSTSIFDPYFLLGSGDVDADSAAFLAYLQEESCPIAAILCGHVHGHHVSEYVPGKMQICCSSSMVGACSLLRFIPA